MLSVCGCSIGGLENSPWSCRLPGPTTPGLVTCLPTQRKHPRCSFLPRSKSPRHWVLGLRYSNCSSCIVANHSHTNSSKIASNSSRRNGTTKLSVPIPSFLDSII